MPTNRPGYMTAYRQDKAEGIAVPLCRCGSQLKGKLSKVRGFCSICWRGTPEGIEENRLRVKRFREKRKEV